LRPDSRLDDFGWRSLAAVEFIALVDRHFGVEISPGDFARCETVSDLIALLGGRISSSASA
jgi:acyl carrier protein